MTQTNELQREAARQMTVCNACRYCEGLCAVFPAMERRRVFSGADVDYLANLCHGCGACYFDCQYTPPHPFAVNVPVTFDALRRDSYARLAWPRTAARAFERNALVYASVAVLSVVVFVAAFVASAPREVLFAADASVGAFYAIMPHGVMAGLFGAAFVFACLSIGISTRRFVRAQVPAETPASNVLFSAAHDAARLKNLEGGGMGCMHESERPDHRRRIWHHVTFYGFLACLASTSLGTVAHYGLGLVAPYPLWSPVVVLGTLGGIGLIVGPLGLIAERRRRASPLQGDDRGALDTTFSLVLVALSVTGLALLGLRETAAMNLLLAVHLGLVFAFFVMLPYSRFVHGVYRVAALVRDRREARDAG